MVTGERKWVGEPIGPWVGDPNRPSPLGFVCRKCGKESRSELARWWRMDLRTGEAWTETCAHCGAAFWLRLEIETPPRSYRPPRVPVRRVRPPTPGVSETAGYAESRVRVFDRSAGACELCGRALTISTMHAHHRLPRSAARDDSPANLLALCSRCHRDRIHSRPGEAYELGWLIRRSDSRPPEEVPVKLRVGMSLLGCDGTLSRVSCDSDLHA